MLKYKSLICYSFYMRLPWPHRPSLTRPLRFIQANPGDIYLKISQERIDGHHPVINYLPMLHVLRIQHGALGLQCGGNGWAVCCVYGDSVTQAASGRQLPCR